MRLRVLWPGDSTYGGSHALHGQRLGDGLFDALGGEAVHALGALDRARCDLMDTVRWTWLVLYWTRGRVKRRIRTTLDLIPRLAA